MKFHRLKKALILSAFFIACSFSTSAQPQNNLSCPLFKANESATVQYVHDGDTLFLADKRKVRLLGIDTPELARDEKNKLSPAQPFAREARDYARALIKQYGNQVRLMSGIEKTDHYGRQLFHIQLSDGSLLQNRLLAAGLAVAFTTPPNQQFSHCYRQVEENARTEQIKIWSHSKYQSIPADKLSKDNKGFHIITGKIRHIGESKKAFWLNFYSNFSVRIDKRDMFFFKQPLKTFINKKVVVRGWIRHYKNKAQLSLRHPSAINIVAL